MEYIKFRPFKEGSGTFSSYKEVCENFIKIVKPFILQVPSLLYKIRKDFTKEHFIALQNEVSQALIISEYIFWNDDIVESTLKDVV